MPVKTVTETIEVRKKKYLIHIRVDEDTNVILSTSILYKGIQLLYNSRENMRYKDFTEILDVSIREAIEESINKNK